MGALFSRATPDERPDCSMKLVNLQRMRANRTTLQDLTKYGMSPLKEIVRGDDPEVLDEIKLWGLTAKMLIHTDLPLLAIRERRFNTMRKFLRMGVTFEKFNERGDIQDAVLSYDYAMLSVLMEMGLTIDQIFNLLNIDLVKVAETRDEELWEFLYDKGMDVNYVGCNLGKLIVMRDLKMIDTYRNLGLKLDGYTKVQLPFDSYRLTLNLRNPLTNITVTPIAAEHSLWKYLEDWVTADKE